MPICSHEDLGIILQSPYNPQIHWLTIMFSYRVSVLSWGYPPVLIQSSWMTVTFRVSKPTVTWRCPHWKRPGDVDKLRSLVALAFSDQDYGDRVGEAMGSLFLPLKKITLAAPCCQMLLHLNPRWACGGTKKKQEEQADQHRCMRTGHRKLAKWCSITNCYISVHMIWCVDTYTYNIHMICTT